MCVQTWALNCTDPRSSIIIFRKHHGPGYVPCLQCSGRLDNLLVCLRGVFMQMLAGEKLVCQSEGCARELGNVQEHPPKRLSTKPVIWQLSASFPKSASDFACWEHEMFCSIVLKVGSLLAWVLYSLLLKVASPFGLSVLLLNFQSWFTFWLECFTLYFS